MSGAHDAEHFGIRSGKVLFNFLDRAGSVVAIANAAGVKQFHYAYLPFGDSHPSGTPISYCQGTTCGDASGTGFGYVGYRYDYETGLYHTGARYYDPRLGRFLQMDPIGQAGGLNLYAYVENDPLNLTDPTGLLSFSGVFRFIGGTAEAAIGVGLGVASSWTGVGAIAGAAIALHGADVAQAAWRGSDTYTSQGLQAGGLSQQTANAIDTGITGAAFLVAAAPVVPYGAAALSGGGGGTSVLSTAARSVLPRTVVGESALR